MVIIRISAMALGLISGIVGILPAMVSLAFDFQSWGDASAVGAGVPSIGVILRLMLHGIALFCAMLALLGGVFAVARPRRANALLFVSAIGLLPLTDHFIAWNERIGMAVPILMPPLLLATAAILMFLVSPVQHREPLCG